MNGDRFPNRRAAGRSLAQAVARLGLEDPVVLALPRGGVPVGFEVALALRAPLDILLVRKIAAPGQPEYGIGALVGGAAPQIVLHRERVRMFGADQAYIAREVAAQLAEIERRRTAYHTGPPVPLAGRALVVADDGIATGGTVRVALEALGKLDAARIVLAVPVAPADSLRELRGLCDEVVCLLSPEPFRAVGAHYADFRQTSDEEVVDLLAQAKSRSS